MKARYSLLAALGGVLTFLLLCTVHFWYDQPAMPISAMPVSAMPISGGAKIPVPDKSSFGDTEDPQARLRYEWMMLRDPATGEIPRDIHKREMEFARTLPTKESLAQLGKRGGATIQSAQWVSRGPWNVGGRTRALGVDVSNANIILAGGVSGGMWRSVNDGSSWTKTTALNSLHSVSCVAQDTRSGHTSKWYYGTGERLGNSAGENFTAEYVGNGIFKSVNNGAAWTQLTSTTGGDPQLFDRFFDFVWNIAVHPTNGHVYAATYGAIARSTDEGNSWTSVRGAPAAPPNSEMTDVAIASNGTIYASGSPGALTLQGVWRSTDGTNWTNVTPNDMSAVRRIVIGVARSNPSVVYLLAETPAAGLNDHSLWRSADGGTTWVNRSANLPAYGGNVGNFNSQNSYDLVITVKPDNENVVIIGGTNLYRSTDGFASTGNSAWVGGYSTANDISLYPNHHPDNHSFAWAPNNPSVLYSGHDGGVSKSTNVLATPHVWQQLSNGYLTTQCYTVAMDHGTNANPDILSGFQDNGCWAVSSSSPTASWVSVNSGDGAFTAIANGGSSIYVSSQNGRTFRLFGSGQFARVDPQGGTGYLFINPFVLDRNNSNIMYFAGGSYVWRNSDLTQIPAGTQNPPTTNWTRLNNTFINGGTVTALGVSTANPANRVYVGWSAGYLYRVDNAHSSAYTVTDIGAAIPSGNISCAAVNPTDGNKALVVFSNYNEQSLWYTADGGLTWTDVEGNLAGANGPSCRYATIVPSGGVTTYVLGTSIGLFSTTLLSGASTVWALEGANTIGNVVVPFLDSRTSDGAVIVGTHANGTYSSVGSVDVEEQGTVPGGFVLHQNYPNPFNPSTKIGFKVQGSGLVSLKVFDVLGGEVATLVNEDLNAGSYATKFDAVNLASGVYYYTLQAGSLIQTKKMLLVR